MVARFGFVSLFEADSIKIKISIIFYRYYIRGQAVITYFAIQSIKLDFHVLGVIC